MATRKQIAELAGVSQATVSRLLNGDAKLRITAQTRRRIMRVKKDKEENGELK